MANQPAFLRSVERQRREQIRINQRLVKRMADVGVRYIKERIPPGATRSAGMPYTFPGYAAEGELKANFRHTRVVQTSTQTRTTVGLQGNANRLVRIKAHVHERGKLIKAKRAPYLRFQVRGQWVRTKQVQIRAKRYFRSSYQELRRRFRAELNRVSIGA